MGMDHNGAIDACEWEVLALQAGATILLRPMDPQPRAEFLARGVVSVVPQWPLQDGVRWFMADGCSELVPGPWQPGDVLRFRETWAPVTACEHYNHLHGNEVRVLYKADGHTCVVRWRSPVTMPAWASRLSRTVKAVRAVRVNQVSAEAIKALGIEQQSDWEDGRKCSIKQLQGRFLRRWTEDHPRLPWGEAWAWQLTVERSE